MRALLISAVLCVAAGCLGGHGADSVPAGPTSATVTYAVGVVPGADGRCSYRPMCLPNVRYRCPRMADRCFTTRVAGHPGVRVELPQYRIVCHGGGRPEKNPPGVCQAIAELVRFEAESDPSACNAGLGWGILPYGRVVGRVDGRYVSESITDMLCALGADGARAVHDRHVLMPQLFRSS